MGSFQRRVERTVPRVASAGTLLTESGKLSIEGSKYRDTSTVNRG